MTTDVEAQPSPAPEQPKKPAETKNSGKAAKANAKAKNEFKGHITSVSVEATEGASVNCVVMLKSKKGGGQKLVLPNTVSAQGGALLQVALFAYANKLKAHVVTGAQAPETLVAIHLH